MMASKSKAIDTEEEIRAAFNVFDRNNDGVISASELREVMASIGEKLTDAELDEIIKEVDKDGNGTIDCEFFQALIEICENADISLVHEFLQVLNRT